MIYYLLVVGFGMDSFLQITPESELGEGLEDLNEQLSSISSESSTSLGDLNSILESQKQFAGTTADYLLTNEINTLESELESLDDQIAALEALGSEVDCSFYESCEDCTSESSCVWCSIEKFCVQGDSNGPLEGECSSFHYEDCSSARCDQYIFCDVCISDTQCGWCQDGHYCFDTTRFDTQDCPGEFFYHMENNHNCPQDKPDQSSQAPVTSYSEQLDYLYAQKETIESQVEELDELRVDTVQEANTSISMPKEPDYVSLDGLSDSIEDLRQEETEDMQAFASGIWEEWSTTVSDGAEGALESEYSEVSAALDEYS